MKNEVIHLDTIVVHPNYDDNKTKKDTNSNSSAQNNKYLLKVKFWRTNQKFLSA